VMRGRAAAPQAAAHNGGVNSVQLDLVEQRFLLAGGADGSVAVYDVECCGAPARASAAPSARSTRSLPVRKKKKSNSSKKLS
jgi:hypothetical protein